jgi:peptidoglycan/xylan/chitin deacetylase (PgdA/CDA1 family)
VAGVLKLLAAALLDHSGALSLLSAARTALAGPEVRLLGFHRIVDDPRALPPEILPTLCVSTRGFGQLMRIARRDFDVLTLDEAVAALEGRRPLERDSLAITFDDGYRDVYLRARPILRDLGLPATVFVPTGFIDSMRPLLHDRLYALLVRARHSRRDLSAAPMPRLLRMPLARAESLLHHRSAGAPAALDHLMATLPTAALNRVADGLEDLLGGEARGATDDGALVMSERELARCAEDRIMLGGHTVDHVVLTHEPPARIQRELERPRRDLEAIAGRPCTAFAYCNGMVTPQLIPFVRAAGYRAAVTTHDAPNRPGQDPLVLHRKVLFESHLAGPGGTLSPSLARLQLLDLAPRRPPPWRPGR